MTDGDPSRRRFLSPLFVTTALVLLAAGIGLRPAVGALLAYYGKEPIDLRRALDDFGERGLPSFELLSTKSGHDPGARNEAIGTDDWVELTFRLREPDARGRSPVAKMLVTYYSDPRDTIPHTPEVCYRQGGATVRQLRTIELDAPDLSPDGTTIEARLLDIEQSLGDLTIVYVIYCNGSIYNDRESARWAIGMPGDKYTYFSKVEALVPLQPGLDFDETAELAAALLIEALPELIDAYYPRPEDLRRR